MKSVAAYLGKAAAEKQPEVATVRCGGTCEKRPRTNEYNGAKSCAVAASLYVGETGCAFGCLGFGDCVAVCAFDAIHINPETGLPEVDADQVHGLRRLREGVSENDHRIAEEMAQEPRGLRVVRVEG